MNSSPRLTPIARWLLPTQVATIIGVAFLIYAPVLHGDWIWDDNVDVVQNPALRSGSGLWTIWFKPGSLVDYYPVKATVQWVQWHLWGEATFGYHLNNVALHIAGALLFWRVLAQLGLKRAWLGALIFTVHPAQVESVAWIAELKNTLATPLFLLSAIFYLESEAGRPRKFSYTLAVGFFLAAMLTKPVMAMFPLVLLLDAWWKRGRPAWSDARATAPFFLISLVIGFITLGMRSWYVQSHHLFSTTIPLDGVLSRLALAGLSLGFYFWTAVWPADLSPLYPQWVVDPPSAADFLPWVPLVGIVLWLGFTGRRGALFGLGFFVLMLAPFVGPFSANYMNFTWVMDHFLYIPIMGLIGLAVAGVEIAERLVPASTRYAGAGIIAAALLVLTAESRDYAGHFANEMSLWSRVVEYAPGSWMGHNNFGNVLVMKNRLEDAEQQYQEALLINPGSSEAECNYGIDLLNLGRPADALSHFEKAGQLDSGYPELHANWGVALARLGRNEEATDHLNQALKLRPNYAVAHYNLGEVLFNQRRYPEAAAEYERAAQLDPTLAEAQHNWGLALSRMGRLPESIDPYRAAVRIKPAYAEAQADLADALLQTGQPLEALEHYPIAAQLDPNNAKVQGNWGFALAQTGHSADAIPHYAEALRIKPGDPFVENDWGNALTQLGQIDDAIAHFQAALRIKPDYAEAHNNFGIALAQAGRKTEALAEFQKALQLNSGYTGAHDNLGITLLAVGRQPEAQKEFENALKLNPQDTVAEKNLQLLRQGQPAVPAAKSGP
jgi:tetratricopeptide (TPR) repeat protein